MPPRKGFHLNVILVIAAINIAFSCVSRSGRIIDATFQLAFIIVPPDGP